LERDGVPFKPGSKEAGGEEKENGRREKRRVQGGEKRGMNLAGGITGRFGKGMKEKSLWKKENRVGKVSIKEVDLTGGVNWGKNRKGEEEGKKTLSGIGKG